jgi:hypothetical protein
MTAEPQLSITDQARLLSKVRFPDGPTGCWMWDGTVDDGNQPIISLGGRARKVRTVMREQYPTNGAVLPICCVPLCVASHHKRSNARPRRQM